MMTGSAKKIVAALSVLLLALAAYWYWSPLLALQQLQSAAKEMDGPAFNEHVDYPRLRESVKASILGRRAAASPGEDTGAAIGRAFGEAIAGRLIDAMVQPEVVMRMMERGKLRVSPSSSSEDGEHTGEPGQKNDWFAEREGVNTFIAYVGKAGEPKERRLGLVMERSGFATWRLVDIEMPAKDEAVTR